MISNMRAKPLLDTRVVYDEDAFAELVVWHVPGPLAGSSHNYKYRLAYVVAGRCVVRFDNEAGKGDHRHESEAESPYRFSTPERLVADFENAIARWNHENRHTRS